MEKFIFEQSNFIPHEICQKIIRLFESSNSIINGTIEYTFDTKTKTKHIREKHNKEAPLEVLSKEIDDTIHNYVKEAVKLYEEYIHETTNFLEEYHPLDRLLAYKTIRDIGYCVQKISKGGKYEWHSDGLPGDNLYVQVIIYLNTMNVQDGGYTELINGRKFKPESGKIVIFPCCWTTIHRGCEVKNGSKYIVTTAVTADY